MAVQCAVFLLQTGSTDENPPENLISKTIKKQPQPYPNLTGRKFFSWTKPCLNQVWSCKGLGSECYADHLPRNMDRKIYRGKSGVVALARNLSFALPHHLFSKKKKSSYCTISRAGSRRLGGIHHAWGRGVSYIFSSKHSPKRKGGINQFIYRKRILRSQLSCVHVAGSRGNAPCLSASTILLDNGFFKTRLPPHLLPILMLLNKFGIILGKANEIVVEE